MSERTHASSWQPFAALGIGVLAISTASIFIRLAQEESAPSLVLAAARLSVASLTLTPLVFSRCRQEIRAMPLADFRWILAAGLALGLHFATWITSLEYTAVVNSVVLVTTSPLWVALLAPLVLSEKPGRWAIAGLALALGGGILVGLSGGAGKPPTRHDPLLGEGLALFGAWMAAVYFVIGRRIRVRLSVTAYSWMVYSTAAILLIGTVAVWGIRVGGLPGKAYLWMILIGLVPQLIGHSSFNYALGFLPAVYVSLAVLGEPVGSGLLAVIFLDEWPVLLQIAGSALILAGIGVATQDKLIGKAEAVAET